MSVHVSFAHDVFCSAKKDHNERICINPLEIDLPQDNKAMFGWCNL